MKSFGEVNTELLSAEVVTPSQSKLMSPMTDLKLFHTCLPPAAHRSGGKIHHFSFDPPPLLVRVQISDMVTRYKREEITVWASASSAIMENCQKTVERPATWGRQSSPRDNLPPHLLPELANLCFLFAERLHAVHVHCEEGIAAPAPLLHRPAALRAAGREPAAVLPAAYHQQVWAFLHL